jgi:hypothetical protein
MIAFVMHNGPLDYNSEKYGQHAKVQYRQCSTNCLFSPIHLDTTCVFCLVWCTLFIEPLNITFYYQNGNISFNFRFIFFNKHFIRTISFFHVILVYYVYWCNWINFSLLLHISSILMKCYFDLHPVLSNV